MPYSQAHKRQTRERIVETACRAFNRRGFVAVSIDDVMAEAGLTRGGFYNHFANKEDLLVAVLEHHGQCEPTARWEGMAIDAQAPAAEISAQTIDAYLSSEHLGDLAGHCPLVALPADVARGGRALQSRYRDLVEKMIAVHAEANDGDRPRALAVTALSVGAMLIARTAGSEQLALEMLRAARDHAHGLQAAADRPERPRDASGASGEAAISKAQ